MVIKTGASFFDQFHAWGVSISVAHLTRCPVEIFDRGLFFKLVCEIQELPGLAVNLSHILVLPTLEQVLAFDQKAWPEPSLPIATLDGLLAALFTVRGPRVVSVDDLLDKLKKSVTWDKCLEKITKALSRWQRFIDRKASKRDRWLQEALSDYQEDSPVVSRLRPGSRSDMAVMMTLDPSLGYALYQPISDGQPTQKRNLTVDGTLYAPIFAMIGAARFLRAQRVANDWVNLYVPTARHMVISSETSLPLLKSTPQFSSQAVVYQWLNNFFLSHQPSALWNGLGYQTLQTQGASQSISLGRGYLDHSWLADLVAQTGSALVAFWRSILVKDQRQTQIDMDDLIEALLERSLTAWLNHLRHVAFYSHRSSGLNIRLYSTFEMRKVICAMKDNSVSDLFAPGTGTLRFGHALRQLGRVKKGALLDIIAALDEVQTLERFIRILGIVTQQCGFAEVQSVFIFVPDDDDLARIIEETQHHGVGIVANLLIVLSTAWYPSTTKGKAFSRVRPQPLFQSRRQVGQGTGLARRPSRHPFGSAPTPRKKFIKQGERND